MSIVVYTDDAPISEDKLASGMSRVNRRLFLAIKENISTILISYQHGFFSNEDLDKELNSKINPLRINLLFAKIIRKINKAIEKFLNIDLDLLFHIGLSKKVKRIKESRSDFLFVPLGSNIRAYRRAIELSKRTKLPLIIYIVDEFMSSAILSNDSYAKNLTQKYLTQWLKQTKKIFVISEGMKEFLKENHDVESVVLNLPFKKKYNVDEVSNNYILFLGNLSHFYQDGLIELLIVIEIFNQTINEYKQKLILRLTIDKLPNQYEKYKDIIVYSKIHGDEGLAKEINSALFCFIPYSFDKKYKGMVMTSFPSKTLECLSYAKNILIYGPSYSSSVRYFYRNKLATVLDKQDSKKLYDNLKNMYSGKQNNSEIYTKSLSNNHNYEYIKSTILESIND
jgi:hypothetical protein